MEIATILLFVMNIIIVLVIATVVYYLLKKTIKIWIKEALTEFEKDNRKENRMAKVREIQAKYGGF